MIAETKSPKPDFSSPAVFLPRPLVDAVIFMAAKEEVSATQSAQGGGRGGWKGETNSGLETSVVSCVKRKTYSGNHHVVLFPHHPPPLRLPSSVSVRTFFWLSLCLSVPDYRTMTALRS